MAAYKSLSQLTWSILSSRKTKSNYIPPSSTSIDELTDGQRESAKKAIEWLISKAPHTVNEIAEHFEMSTVLVAVLVSELITAGRIRVQASNPELLELNEKNFKG